MFLTRISVGNPVFATMMMIALVVIGLFSYRGLAVDQFPEIDFPIVIVQTAYPGASPETVETDVTRKIEDAVNTVNGINKLNSRSYEGRSVVIIEFNLNVDGGVAAQDVREKVAAIRASFRDEVKEPEITRFKPDEQPIVSIAVNSEQRPLRELTTLADQIIVKRLQNVQGVGAATVVGGVKRQINIFLKPTEMQSLQIGIDQIINTVKAENQDVPAGSLVRGVSDTQVQVEGRMTDPSGFRRLIVTTRNGVPIYLSQVADIVDGQEELESTALFNGERALAIDVIKTQGSNTIAVADGLIKVVEALQQSLPPDVKLTVLRDSSLGIRNSVANVQATMIEGGILTVMIVFLFLGSWRSTVITGLTLPISVIGTFAAIAAFDFTINALTLMALSLSIGILIDDAIVVRENIMRHLAMGKSHRAAALEGTREIGLPVLATTLSIVAVFLPVAFMDGIIGRFFFQFGVTVAVAVIISLFVSFTLDPMLSSIWYDPAAHGPRKGLQGRLANAADWMTGGLARFYRRILAWSLRNRIIVLVAVFGIFLASFRLVPLIGAEFLPPSDLGDVVVTARTPTGSSVEYTTAKMRQVDTVVRELPEVSLTYTVVNSGAAQGKNIGNIYVKLVPLSERERGIDEVIPVIRERLGRIPGLEISVGIPGLGGVQKPIQVSIQGTDLVALDRLSQQALAAAATVPGLVDIESSLRAARPTLSIRLKREEASNLGIGLSQVVAMLRPLLSGDDASTWKAPDGETYDVQIRLPRGGRETQADIEGLFVASSLRNPDGTTMMVPLSQIVSIHESFGASQIDRRDLFREVQISANLYNRPLGDASADFAAALAKLDLPPGYRVVFGGDTENMQESAGYAAAALLLAIVFIYLILASQFASFIQPVAIMMSLPLSLLGVFLGLLLFGSTLNMMSIIGFIMLMGLVTKNAILLVDFINQGRAEGKDRLTAILDAGEVRLRPILMTSLAMIFGMVPLALAIGDGAEQRAPMAHAVIGGLFTSTIFTLVVVPIIFTYLDGAARRVRSLFPKRHVDEGDSAAHQPAE